jgi:hypothetical protein
MHARLLKKIPMRHKIGSKTNEQAKRSDGSKLHKPSANRDVGVKFTGIYDDICLLTFRPGCAIVLEILQLTSDKDSLQLRASTDGF